MRCRRSTQARAARALGFLASLIVGAGTFGMGGATQLAAQDARSRSTAPRARAVLALVPDTVLVGEPFMLGIAVRVEPGWEVVFPGSLPLRDGIEERAPIESRQIDPNVWRADYRLVAWTLDPGELPEVEVELVLEGERHTRVFPAPRLTVLSVLPEDQAGLELREAKPFFEQSSLWWLLILLGLLVLLAWLFLRSRRPTLAEEAAGSSEPTEPVDHALGALSGLRERWSSGAMAGPEFHDALEATLRRYAEATRDWPPGTPIGRLPNGDRALAAVLQRSARTRFGGLEARSDDVALSLDVCEGWLRQERESAEASPSPGAEPEPDGATRGAGTSD